MSVFSVFARTDIHTWSLTATAAFSDHKSTVRASSGVNITPLTTRDSLLPVGGPCETIHRLTYDRISATDNSDDRWEHFCL